MQKRNKQAKRPREVNQLAHFLGDRSTRERQPEQAQVTGVEISRVMAELGRRGGRIGGKKRLDTLSPARRSEIALKAAQARWAKRKRKGTI